MTSPSCQPSHDEKETYFAEVLRYVVLNPVRAKMVERLEDYPWSSYRATAGLEPAPAWLDVASALHVFGTDTAAAQAEYRSFVTAKLGCEERLWDQVTNAIYLGTTSMRKACKRPWKRCPQRLWTLLNQPACVPLSHCMPRERFG